MSAENNTVIQTNPRPRLLSMKQAIFELGVSRTTAYELIGCGRLRSVTIGRRRFIPTDAIDEFISRLSQGAA